MFPEPSGEEPDFARYNTRVDVTLVAFDDHTPMPFVHPEVYGDPNELDPAVLRQLLIRQAAVRIIAGLETRSLREVADEIGCSHQAIDNMSTRLCARLGLRKLRITETTQQRLRMARRRMLQALSESDT